MDRATEPTPPSAAARPLACVTGASSGIGLAIALELADRGYDLVIVADEPQIVEAAVEVRGHGADAIAIQADLATTAGIEEVAERISSGQRPLEVLVLNAGIGVSGEFVDTELADHLRLIALNVTGAVHLAHLLLPAMAGRGHGRLLVTSSIAAAMPGPYQSTYNASKAFLLLWAQALRVELEDRGVHVTALLPGATDTDFFERADMQGTRLAADAPKDDPAVVARDAVDALLEGRDRVVAGAFRNKLQELASRLLPEPLAARASAPLTRPGGS